MLLDDVVIFKGRVIVLSNDPRSLLAMRDALTRRPGSSLRRREGTVAMTEIQQYKVDAIEPRTNELIA
jgi:hypothetical protein